MPEPIPSDFPMRKPTLRDIAERLGVSIGTVSRVLNRKATISAEVSEKIMKLARAMGYDLRASSAREARKKGKPSVIGYLVEVEDFSNTKADPFHQHFLNGVQQGADVCGRHVIYAPCGDEIRANALPSLVADKIVQGVILKVKASTPYAWIQRICAQVPVVLLMGNFIEREMPSVACDNFGAVYQSLHYLRELGHQRIGFLSVDDVGLVPSSDHQERLEAFLKYSAMFGADTNPRLVQKPMRDHSRETLTEVMSAALDRYLAMGERRPTAVICATDVYAFALLRVAVLRGISVPEEISLISLRNTLECELSNPPLTSISLQEESIGRVAAELLQQWIEAPTVSISHVTVASKLVERLSCAAPKVWR